MVLQASGLISLSNIKSEFNGIDPVELSDYYRGGVYVPNLPLNANVPTSGTINVQNFYGATVATFNISPNVSTVNEGGTVRFNVTTNNFSGTLYWSILGGVTNSDFSSPLNAVTAGGTLTVSANSGLLDLTTSADLTTEGSESFSVRLKALSTSGPVVTQSSNVFINDTSVNPFYVTLTRSTDATIIQPNTVTFTLTSNGIPNGRTVGYTITGVTQDDLTGGSVLSGNFIINNNTAAITVNVASFVGEVFIVDSFSDQVRKYNASQNATSITNELQRRSGNNSFEYMYWRPTGTNLYLLNPFTDSLDQYNLTTPFSIILPNMTLNTVKGFPSAITAPAGLYISTAGTNVVVLDSVDKVVYRMAMGTAWTASTLSSTTFASPVLPLTTYRGLDMSSNGILYFICAVSTSTINAYKGTTAFRPDTMSTTPIESIASPGGSAAVGVRFNSTGTKMYVANQSNNIYYYSLSTPYTLSTASLVTTSVFTSSTLQVTDIYWNETETETLTITTASSDSGGVTAGLPKSNSVTLTT